MNLVCGVLEPGFYEMRAFAGGFSDLSTSGSAEASFDFTLDLTLVCPADLDGDDSIDINDLAILLSNFGTTAGANPQDGDVDGDGDVDLTDLAILLSNFGSVCP